MDKKFSGFINLILNEKFTINRQTDYQSPLLIVNPQKFIEISLILFGSFYF